MSLASVVLDTYGALLIKEHGKGFNVWEINLIRFGFAGACMILLSAILSLRDYYATTVSQKLAATAAAAKSGASADEIVSEPSKEREEQVAPENGTAIVNITTAPTIRSSRAPWYALPLDGSMTKSGWYHVGLGILLVTFLTPSLSNYALFQIALALALTLGSVGPLYALLLGALVAKKAPTRQAWLGAVLTVAGVVVLSFRGTLPAEPHDDGS